MLRPRVDFMVWMVPSLALLFPTFSSKRTGSWLLHPSLQPARITLRSIHRVIHQKVPTVQLERLLQRDPQARRKGRLRRIGEHLPRLLLVERHHLQLQHYNKACWANVVRKLDSIPHESMAFESVNSPRADLGCGGCE
jgi:hypothetical protein